MSDVFKAKVNNEWIGIPTLQGEKGEKGDTGLQGESATVSVGSTRTGQPGSNAVVINSGTSLNAILDFIIPKGEKGDPGTPGLVHDVLVSYDDGQTWHSAMSGNVAQIIMTGGGGGSGEINTINIIQRNGANLPIFNKTVNIDVPVTTSQLTNDSGFLTSSSLSTVGLTGSYNDLINKPTIPAAQINSDWNASSGVAKILNKPIIHEIPTGGTAGQVLTKTTSTDYDVSWSNAGSIDTYPVVVVTNGEIPSNLKVGQLCIVQTTKTSDFKFYVVVPANQGWMIVTGSPTAGIYPNVLTSSSSTRNFEVGSSSGSLTKAVCLAVRTS